VFLRQVYNALKNIGINEFYSLMGGDCDSEGHYLSMILYLLSLLLLV
jgi:hypothetical protein